MDKGYSVEQEWYEKRRKRLAEEYEREKAKLEFIRQAGLDVRQNMISEDKVKKEYFSPEETTNLVMAVHEIVLEKCRKLLYEHHHQAVTNGQPREFCMGVWDSAMVIEREIKRIKQ